MPLANFEDERFIAGMVSGGKPLVITEVGYHNNVATSDPHRGISEKAYGMYAPRTVLEAFRDGILRTYFYQFADAWTDAEAQRIGISPSENSFGLLRSDLSRRPSFLALRNLLRVVGGSAPVGSPGGLRFGLEGAGPDVRQLLLRSADGSFALVLWRQVPVWNRDARAEVTPAPDALEVVMGQPVSLARRFDPVASDAESQRWTNPRRIPVSLAGAPVVLRLTAAAAAPPATPPSTPPATPPSTPPATPPSTDPPATPPPGVFPGQSGSGTPNASPPPSQAGGGDGKASDESAPRGRCQGRKASLRRARIALKRWQRVHGRAAHNKPGPKARARLRHLRLLVERRRRAAVRCVRAQRAAQHP
jgi:hypothetical protein